MAAAAPLLCRLARSGAKLGAVHMVDVTAAPCSWEHFHHDLPAWYEVRRSPCPFPADRFALGRESAASWTPAPTALTSAA